jgi:hypothetical protein
MNPEVHLFTLEAAPAWSMELGVGVGRRVRGGGSPRTGASAHRRSTPRSRRSRASPTNVEMSRLGKITDYEKLVWRSGRTAR